MTKSAAFEAAVRSARVPVELDAGGMTRKYYDVSGIPGASELPRALVVLLERSIRAYPARSLWTTP